MSDTPHPRWQSSDPPDFYPDSRWDPQPAGLVETPRYPKPDPDAWCRGALLRTPSGEPSHWLLWQVHTGAMSWDRVGEWKDPEVRAVEGRIVQAVAVAAAAGVDAERTFDTLRGEEPWEAVRRVDLWEARGILTD